MNSTLSLLVLVVMLLVFMVLGGHMILGAGIVALLTIFVGWQTWYRMVPLKFKFILTTIPGLWLMDGLMWYVGWIVVRDGAYEGKIGYLMFHCLLIPSLYVERRRVRGLPLWGRE